MADLTICVYLLSLEEYIIKILKMVEHWRWSCVRSPWYAPLQAHRLACPLQVRNSVRHMNLKLINSPHRPEKAQGWRYPHLGWSVEGKGRDKPEGWLKAEQREAGPSPSPRGSLNLPPSLPQFHWGMESLILGRNCCRLAPVRADCRAVWIQGMKWKSTSWTVDPAPASIVYTSHAGQMAWPQGLQKKMILYW